MSTITKERTAGIARGEKCYTHDDVVELARIALASLEAEAVAYMTYKGYLLHAADPKLAEYSEPTPLYDAPPAPVSVPDDVLKGFLPDAEKAEFWFEHNGKILFEGVKFNNAVFDACRAAMLQGAEQPQNQQQNIPENIPVNTPCKEAPEHIWLQTAGVWPENGEFSELTWCSDNQHPDDTLYVRAEVVPGNSPVIPDAYDIEAFGVFRATEGENGLMMDVDHFHFETDSCPQIGKDKFVPKFAIQAIINRLQKDCDNMEAD